MLIEGRCQKLTVPVRTTMFDTASASNGVKLALLEGQLLTRDQICATKPQTVV